MKNISPLIPFLDKLKEELIAPDVEKIMAEHFAVPPPNTLEPKKIWQKKIRDNLTDLLSGQAVIDKTVAGFDAIKEDLRSNLSPVEMDKIMDEWNHGIEVWLEKMKIESEKVQEMIKNHETPTQGETSAEAAPAESLQSVMGISEETLTQFYEAGNRYFEFNDFQKASDVYFVITSLDQRRYNVWIALGLSEVRCERIEPALVSFGMASITDPQAPYPYLYSAECCLKDNRGEEAAIYLNLAKEAVENSSLENKQGLLDSVTKLQQAVK